jgi:hypothetical protein
MLQNMSEIVWVVSLMFFSQIFVKMEFNSRQFRNVIAW